MKTKTLILFLLLSASRLSAAYINTDSGAYDYYWDGETTNPEACKLWEKHIEDFYVGAPPYPMNQQFIKYAPLPCSYNNLLFEVKLQWTTVAMNNAIEYIYYDNVPVETNNVGASPSFWPKRIKEMSNYLGKGLNGGVGNNSRISWGKTRFWVNATTNGLYHCKAKLVNTGYWDNWFPGHLFPGDIFGTGVPAKHTFSYVADGVKIGGMPCNANGEVTFYHNWYDGGTLDLSPTVSNFAHAQHYVYEVELSFIP